MKKIFILIIAIFTLSFFGCQKKIEEPTEKPTVILPGGSPLISVAKILEDADYQIVAGPDLFPAEFKKRNAILLLPQSSLELNYISLALQITNFIQLLVGETYI